MIPNNEDRAFWAQEALDFFQQLTSTDTCDALADLLCNLMHAADRQPQRDENGERMLSFAEALHRAELHYNAEIIEEMVA